MIFEKEKEILGLHTSSISKKEGKEFMEAYKSLPFPEREMILNELNSAMGIYVPEEEEELSFQSFQKGGIKKYQKGGSREADIRKLQQELARSGFNLPKSTKKNGQYDGVLGQETVKALQQYAVQNYGQGVAPQTAINNILGSSPNMNFLYDATAYFVNNPNKNAGRKGSTAKVRNNAVKKAVKSSGSDGASEASIAYANSLANDGASRESIAFANNPAQQNRYEYPGVLEGQLGARRQADMVAAYNPQDFTNPGEVYVPERQERQSRSLTSNFRPMYGSGVNYESLNDTQRNDYFNSQLGALAEGVGILPFGDLTKPIFNRVKALRGNKYNDLFNSPNSKRNTDSYDDLFAPPAKPLNKTSVLNDSKRMSEVETDVARNFQISPNELKGMYSRSKQNNPNLTYFEFLRRMGQQGFGQYKEGGIYPKFQEGGEFKRSTLNFYK